MSHPKLCWNWPDEVWVLSHLQVHMSPAVSAAPSGIGLCLRACACGPGCAYDHPHRLTRAYSVLHRTPYQDSGAYCVTVPS